MIDDATSTGPLSGLRLLLGVASSIAAYKALELCSSIRKQGGEVRVVMSSNASHLISLKAFDAITHQRTVSELWGSDDAGEMDHLTATKWGNVFAVYPATANTLGQLAHGLANDALSTFAIAWNKSPLIIAPAMNPEMWKNIAVQDNVELLAKRGHVFVGPGSGRLACDDVGVGRLAEPYEMLSAITNAFIGGIRGVLTGRKVVITAGATREFFDDVRCITNPSTGRMGLELARAARLAGAEVSLLAPFIAEQLPDDLKGINLYTTTTAQSMLAAVQESAPEADIVIFAAAVSDWRPTERKTGKAKKEEAPSRLTVELERTPDVAFEASKRKKDNQVFVGFAAESANLAESGKEKMRRKKFDLLFANPINEEDAGFGTTTNRGLLLNSDGGSKAFFTTPKAEIARSIIAEATALLSKSASRQRVSRKKPKL